MAITCKQMEPINTILHIGYPKTATKWFQNEFYPRVNGIFFIHRKDVFKWLAFQNIFDYSPVETLEHFVSTTDGKRLVICDEIILGGLDIGFGSGEYVCMMANRLKETFGEASIIIFIRNQHSALESVYGHYIKSGGTYSVKKYMGIYRKFTRPFHDYHLFNPDLFQYNKIVELYARLFGSENVHVCLFEDFKANPEGFIDQFSRDFNLSTSTHLNFEPQNIKLSTFSVSLMRFSNHFTLKNTVFKHYFFSIPRLYRVLLSVTQMLDKSFFTPRPFTLDKGVHSWIDERFRMGNRELARWVNMEKLRKYGYPL